MTILGKGIFIYTLLMLSWLPESVAQTPPKSSEAEQTLERALQRWNQWDTAHIQFKYTYRESIARSREYQGEVYFHKEIYHLIMADFEEIFDGNQIYRISHEDEEVTILSRDSITKYQEGGVLSVPQALMQFLDKKKYKLKMDLKQKTPQGTVQYIKILPKDPNTQTVFFLLGILSKSQKLYLVYQKKKNNSQISVRIQKIQTNLKTLDQKIFQTEHESINDYYMNDID